jgi:hypothetical protein
MRTMSGCVTFLPGDLLGHFRDHAHNLHHLFGRRLHFFDLLLLLCFASLQSTKIQKDPNQA